MAQAHSSVAALDSAAAAATQAAIAAELDLEPLPISTPEPFQVEFSAQSIADLHQRLEAARWPEPESSIVPEDVARNEQLLADIASSPRTSAAHAVDRSLLPSFAWLKRSTQAWRALDLDGVQRDINRHPQFITSVYWCKQLHFVHRRSSRPDAIPLLLLHGWPGTFFEFHHCIDLLTEPGFIFSSAPPNDSVGVGDAVGYCRILDSLMLGLGYSRYAAQGGDFGSLHARILGSTFRRPDGTGCRAVHLNFCPTPPRMPALGALVPAWLSSQLMRVLLTEDELTAIEKMRRFAEKGMAYYHMQKTRLSQISFGLTDSPVALLGYLGFNYFMATLGRAYDERHALITCSLFWFTKSVGTSFLPYRNNAMMVDLLGQPKFYIPRLAYSGFPFELVPSPRRFTSSNGNVLFWAKASRGGHFIGQEEPEIFVNHLRLAFSAGARNKQIPLGRDTGVLEDQFHAAEGLWDDQLRTESPRL